VKGGTQCIVCNRKIHTIEKIDEHAKAKQKGDAPTRAIVRGGCSSRMRTYTRNMGLSHQKSCAMLKVWLDPARAQGNP
jgi:uncharacterized protein YlaI